jgi:BCCT family betaine/carnitine transporter
MEKRVTSDTQGDKARGDDDASGYVVGQDNIEIFGLDIHNPVFVISALVVIAFVAFSLIFQTEAKDFFLTLRPWLTTNFDWLFLLTGNVIVATCLLVAVTPLGKVRLGGPDARPDYSYSGWFAMLFAAGMGIGLMFFGVLEPIYHLQTPPLGIDVADTETARRVAMAATIFGS